jgi:D-alanine-D-alanine ligase
VWEVNFGTLSEVSAAIATRKVKWDRAYQEKHGIMTDAARSLPDGCAEYLAKLSKRIHRALSMSGYARMDFRLRADGSVFALEANANPNLSYGEDFAESAEFGALGYEELLDRILRLGLAYQPAWRSEA